MLETQNGSISLQELEKLLEKCLSVQSVAVIPQKISCLLKEHHLMILLHYHQPAMPYPRKVFSLLKDTLDQLLISEKYQILMYLVVQGKYQSAINPPITKLESTPVKLLPSHPVSETITPKPTPKKLPKFLLIGTGIVTTVFLGYLANRHCLFNNCALIPQANQLATQGDLMLEYSPRDLAQAYQKFDQSYQFLSRIPSVSPHYREAQNLAANYQQKAKNIHNFQQALAIKDQALSLTKLPLTINDCNKIESLWTEAIALLEHIHTNAQLYPLAQQELAQINIEKQGIISLKTAQEAAELGKVRESVAQSLDNWQLVAATWRTALERLNQIPQDSQIANQVEITQLDRIYQSRLAQANQQTEQEALALKLYQQGQEKAKLAQNQSNSQQWQASVYHWREALKTIEQIPSETYVFNESQNLLTHYQNSLQMAEQKLTVMLNLERLCTADIKICYYEFTDNLIKVHLTPTYQEQIWQATLVTSAGINAPAQMQLRQHLTGLDNLFQSVSNSSGIPLEVYDAQQVLIVAYLPDN